MMTGTKETPTDVIARQIAVIDELAYRMRNTAGDITGGINPDTATWADVAKYAMQADMARSMLDELDQS